MWMCIGRKRMRATTANGPTVRFPPTSPAAPDPTRRCPPRARCRSPPRSRCTATTSHAAPGVLTIAQNYTYDGEWKEQVAPSFSLPAQSHPRVVITTSQLFPAAQKRPRNAAFQRRHGPHGTIRKRPVRRCHAEGSPATHCNSPRRRFNGRGVAKYATDGASTMCVARAAAPPRPPTPLNLALHLLTPRRPSPSRCRSNFTWNAGDVYDGEFKDHVRHGNCRCDCCPAHLQHRCVVQHRIPHLADRYTWFNGESMECQWVDGRCDEWSQRNARITASKPAVGAVAGKPSVGSYRVLAAAAVAAAVLAGIVAAARARQR
jgi:hypothetical protein